MVDRDHAASIEGDHLRRLVNEVVAEFRAREACDHFERGFKQVNSVRVVTSEVFEDLSLDAQLGVLGDLLQHTDRIVFERSKDEIFEASDTPSAFITDVACEVVWQLVNEDPVVRMEDEAREELADY